MNISKTAMGRIARGLGLWLGLPGLLLTLGACVKNAPETRPDVIATPPLSVTFVPQKGDFISQYGAPLSVADVAAMAKGYDYILIGEGHRNPVDHQVQQALLQALSGDGDGLSLGLEMIAVDKQQELDDFCKGQVDLDGLPGELDWAKNWGYDFNMFREHFAIAKRNGVPVAGLNVPSEVTRKIARQGIDSLTDEEKALLPKDIVPPSTDQLAFLNAVMSMHKDRDAADPQERERFRLVQSIWDSKMAEEAVRLRKQYDWPVLIVAGDAHVEYGWGIAKRLRWYDPSARVLTIVPWRGDEFDSEAGDVFFYSPDTYRSRMGMVLSGRIGGGILVESVARGSRADRAGLRPGDVLVEAAGVPLDELMSLHMAGTKAHDADASLIFKVQRGDQTLNVDMGKLGQHRPVVKPKPAAEPTPAPAPATKAAPQAATDASAESATGAEAVQAPSQEAR